MQKHIDRVHHHDEPATSRAIYGKYYTKQEEREEIHRKHLWRCQLYAIWQLRAHELSQRYDPFKEILIGDW